jgi:hypothetical protein
MGLLQVAVTLESQARASNLLEDRASAERAAKNLEQLVQALANVTAARL